MMSTLLDKADVLSGMTWMPAERRQRLTVMHVTWSLVAGGAEMYALTVASNLDRRNYRAEMCAVDEGGALEAEVARCGMRHTIMHRRPGIEWALMWRLWRLFRRAEVDVVHTHHFNQLFYSLPGAMLVGARVVHTEHSVEAYRRRRLRVALRLMSLFCHRVIAIGMDGYRTLRDKVGIPERKLELIRAGVDCSVYSEGRDGARRQLNLGRDDRVVAIIARLYPEKNHLLLLEAFARVVQRMPQARLLIVGDGTEREAIGREIERLGLRDSARMLGVRRDVPVILAASDALVLCSDREGLPLCILEAMAAARPVVATAVGDVPMVVRDGATGRLVPARDPLALAEALEEVLADPQRAALMGQRGRELAEEQYSLRTMIARHEAIYEGGGG